MRAEWTQYAESASLPMSKKYRDDLRERISRIDVEALTGEERSNMKKLLRMLSEDYSQEEVSRGGRWWVGVLPVVALATGVYIYYLKREALTIPTADELRRAREAKFE